MQLRPHRQARRDLLETIISHGPRQRAHRDANAELVLPRNASELSGPAGEGERAAGAGNVPRADPFRVDFVAVFIGDMGSAPQLVRHHSALPGGTQWVVPRHWHNRYRSWFAQYL